MAIRDDIVSSAQDWSGPVRYRPTASELVSFFQNAGAQQAPSESEAQKSLNTLDTGCYVGGAVKQWCGIFACSVAANKRVLAYWDLLSGQIRGAGVKKIWGNSG